MAEIFALREEGEEGEGADGDEDFVARVVVGCIVGAVDFLRGVRGVDREGEGRETYGSQSQSQSAQ